MTTGLSLRGRLGRDDRRPRTRASRTSSRAIIPGMPRVVIHNQVLAYEVGAGVHPGLVRRRGGQARPVRADHRGLDREREDQRRRPLVGLRRQSRERASRSRPTSGSTGSRNKAAAVVAIGTCATYGGIPAMKNNPTGAMGLPDYLGWNWKSKAGLPVVCIPGCPAQPDNMTETLLYLVLHLGGLAPAPELDDQLRPEVALRPHGARELQPRRLLRAGQLRDRVRRRPPLPRQARLQGPGRQVQRAGARLGQRHRRLPERRRHLHGLHDARLPRQVHAVHGGGRRGHGSTTNPARFTYGPVLRSCRSWEIRHNGDKEPEWRHNAAASSRPATSRRNYAATTGRH